jgi:hypothetical protein
LNLVTQERNRSHEEQKKNCKNRSISFATYEFYFIGSDLLNNIGGGTRPRHTPATEVAKSMQIKLGPERFSAAVASQRIQ